jgi:hypothetical protein
MKKLISFVCTILMIFSCSSLEDDISGLPSKVAIKWKFKVNGVLYQWEGFHPYSPTSGQIRILLVLLSLKLFRSLPLLIAPILEKLCCHSLFPPKGQAHSILMS